MKLKNYVQEKVTKIWFGSKKLVNFGKIQIDMANLLTLEILLSLFLFHDYGTL